MKNKIPVILLALLFLCPALQAREKDPARLMAGIVLAAAGGLLAYNGFQMADISAPSMDMQSFTTVTTGSGPFTITADGTVINTGNVDLRNIKITVYYRDTLGADITNTITAVSAPLSIGKSTLVSIPAAIMPQEPLFFSVKYQADFDRKLENYSVPAGAAGSVIFATGIYFICDYIFDISDFLDKNDAKVQLSAVNDGFSLITSKRF